MHGSVNVGAHDSVHRRKDASPILSPCSPLSPRSPQTSSKSSQNSDFQSEIALQQNSEIAPLAPLHEQPDAGDCNRDLSADASEVAFRAQTASFATKDNAHELALRRLVDDLVENGSQASDGELSNTEVIADSSTAIADMEIPAEITDTESGIPSVAAVTTPTKEALSSSKTKSNSPKPQASSMKTKTMPAGDAKLHESKRHTPPKDAKIKRPPASLIVKHEHASPPDSKRRVHPIKLDKEKTQEKEKASPSSPTRASPESPRLLPGSPSSKASPLSPLKPLRISPPSSSEKVRNSSSRTPASRFTEPIKFTPKPTASGKNLEAKATQATETDKVQRRVKEFFQRRKSATAIGSKIPAGLVGDNESVVSSEQNSLFARENPDLGPFLLKLAKQAAASGDSPQKALDFAIRAAKSYETAADGKPSLDLVMSLHVLAAIHCTLGHFEEAIPVLQRSINVPDVEEGGQEHALAAFAGHMQLGDTLALLGKGEDALDAYHTGFEVQKRALGDKDPRVGETCRYLAEAHAQVMQFDKAEEFCQHALDIHKEHSSPASIEESTDRRLMGLILNGKGQHESALEHLVLASMALIANGKDVEVAAVDTSIGDTYVSLGRFDEAVFAYQKALTVFKASKGENHVAVASVYVSLAELYVTTGKIRESRTYCESALRIYNKQGAGQQLDEVASGLTELAVVYEALNQQEKALSLLQEALAILETSPGQQSAVAGVEAQIGVLNYMCGKFAEARTYFSKSVSKLRASAEKTSPLFGIVLNQMGLSCVHLSEIEAATESFVEARIVLEAACGPYHPDTLAVYSNLAGAYDALGRLSDAIRTLQYVVTAREEKLGTATPEVDDERNRLAELLKEAGLLRARRVNNSLELLMQSNPKTPEVRVAEQKAATGIIL